MYKLIQYGSIVHLRSPSSGLMKKRNEDVDKEIKTMSSYRGEMIFIKPGDTMCQSEDAVTQPGKLFLVNQNQLRLADDYNRINDIQDDLFMIE